jgi:RHS repeat-associated protein
LKITPTLLILLASLGATALRAQTTATPVITLATGTYIMPTSTTITDSTSGASILWCYISSGTCTPATSYTASIYVDPASAETICANASATGYSVSSTVCNTYTSSASLIAPVIVWPTPAQISYGTALSATQLDATASVAGTFLYLPAAGTVLRAGPQTLSVVFTPTNTTTYSVVSQSVTIYVQGSAGSTWDTGTVNVTVNGTSVASYNYGQNDTPSSVAEGLAAAASSSLVTVKAVDDALYFESVATGAASNYPYTISATNANPTLFPDPSFVPQPISGSLDGGDTANTPGATIYKFQGTYDGGGNLKSYNQSTVGGVGIMGAWTFSYDTLNRLAGSSGSEPGNPNTNYCWIYDSFGNRTLQAGSSAAFTSGSPNCTPASGATYTSTWAKFNVNNQVTSTSEATSGVAIDSAGNILGDGLNQYLYDADGRICAVASTPIPGMTLMTGYVYDAEGTRVAKGKITSWSCNPGANGFTVLDEYVLGLSGEQVTEMAMDSNNTMAWQHTNVFAAGRLMATYDNDGLHFYLNDPLGTRRAQTDYAGVREQVCTGLPFGDGLTCGNSTQYPTEHHFTGKERDAESGNDYFIARYYESSMGRFMSPDDGSDQDPDDPQSWNLYSYVRNNPLADTDPDGHGCQTTTITSSFNGEPGTTTTVVDRSDCQNGLDALAQNAYEALQRAGSAASQAGQQAAHYLATTNWNCVAKSTGGGMTVGAAAGAVTGLVGLAGGPAVAVTEPSAIVGEAAWGAGAGFTAGLGACGGSFMMSGGSGGGGGGGGSSAQAKKLTPREIAKLKQNGIDPEMLKEETGTTRSGRSDLYKLPNGDIVVKGKGGIGPGEPTGININKL